MTRQSVLQESVAVTGQIVLHESVAVTKCIT